MTSCDQGVNKYAECSTDCIYQAVSTPIVYIINVEGTFLYDVAVLRGPTNWMA